MPDPLYHTGDQHAEALLPPVLRTLHELEIRMAHFATRLRMSDEDREAVKAAQQILQQAHADLAKLVSATSDSSGAAR